MKSGLWKPILAAAGLTALPGCVAPSYGPEYGAYDTGPPAGYGVYQGYAPPYYGGDGYYYRAPPPVIVRPSPGPPPGWWRSERRDRWEDRPRDRDRPHRQDDASRQRPPAPRSGGGGGRPPPATPGYDRDHPVPGNPEPHPG